MLPGTIYESKMAARTRKSSIFEVENCFCINRQTFAYKMFFVLFPLAFNAKPSCATTSRKRPPPINRIQNTKAFSFKALQLEHFVINDLLLETTSITSRGKLFNSFLFFF